MKIFIALFTFLLPAMVFAQNSGTRIDGGDGLFTAIESLIGIILPILYAVAILFFVYRLVTWVLASGDDKSAKLKDLGYSLLFLFVLFSITGIIALLQDTTNLNNDAKIDVPNVQIDREVLKFN